jgi:hypothetical protein
MEKVDQKNYDDVVGMVSKWPPAERFALVQDVLKTLAPAVGGASRRPQTLSKALGLLATNQSAPSDADVEQWLEERRAEKYG